MHTHTHTHTGLQTKFSFTFFWRGGAVQAPRCPLRAPLSGATQAPASALPCQRHSRPRLRISAPSPPLHVPNAPRRGSAFVRAGQQGKRCVQGLCDQIYKTQSDDWQDHQEVQYCLQCYEVTVMCRWRIHAQSNLLFNSLGEVGQGGYTGISLFFFLVQGRITSAQVSSTCSAITPAQLRAFAGVRPHNRRDIDTKAKTSVYLD